MSQHPLDSCGFAILCPERNYGGLLGTAQSVASHYPQNQRCCVVADDVSPRELEEFTNVCPTVVGGKTHSALMNTAMRSLSTPWVYFIVSGLYLRNNQLRRYKNAYSGEKTVLYPVASARWLFPESSINGLLLSRAAFDAVGPFDESPHSLEAARLVWAATAIDLGFRFVALLGVPSNLGENRYIPASRVDVRGTKNMGKFGDYLQTRGLVAEAADGSESVPPGTREKEYSAADKRKPFTYKPDGPMDLPEGVLDILHAFQNKELLSDIEAELCKATPNGKLYHIDKVFGLDEKGGSKIARVDQKQRKAQLSLTKAKLYVVGGAVRDFLVSVFHPNKLHKSPKNYNLATDARPKIVQLILMNAQPAISCKPGPTMGVTLATAGGATYEIETFQEDKAPGAGDKADFVTYTNASRDAMRRDFRANALRYDIEKETIEDDVGGFGDIVENPPKLRTIKPAGESLKQDPIRAFRGLRIHGKMVGGDHTTLDGDLRASLQDFDMGDKVDRTRVHEEFMDGLKVADDQNHYVNNFHMLGKPTKTLLNQLFPGLEVTGKIGIPHNTHPHVVLALILRNNPPERAEKVRAVMQKAGFDAAEVSDVAFLLSLPRFTNSDNANEFFQAMRTGAKKLVPSAVKNYVKWAKLANKTVIERMLNFRKTGGLPGASHHAPPAHAPVLGPPLSPGPIADERYE